MQLKFYFTFSAANVSSLLRRNVYQQDELSPRNEVALFAFTKSPGASRRRQLQLPQNVHLHKKGEGVWTRNWLLPVITLSVAQRLLAVQWNDGNPTFKLRRWGTRKSEGRQDAGAEQSSSATARSGCATGYRCRRRVALDFRMRSRSADGKLNCLAFVDAQKLLMTL